MIDENLPAVGTPEAAVLACVELIARAVQVSEAHLSYWLDLYYQMRVIHEKAAEGEATGDLPAALIEKLDALEAKIDSLTVTVKVENDKPIIAAPVSDEIEIPEGKPVRKPSLPCADQKAIANKSGRPAGSDTEMKKQIFARLKDIRARGVTVMMITDESEGRLSDNVIRDILETRYRPMSDYRALAAALDRCEEKLNLNGQ